MASSWTEEGAAPGIGVVGGGPGAMVGASAIVEGFGAVWGSGAVGGPASGRATVSSDWRSSRSRASSSARSAGRPSSGDVDQIVLDARLAPLPPVGLESPADLIDAAGQVDVQAVEVVAGSVAHLDSVLGPQSVTSGTNRRRCPFRAKCDIALALNGSSGRRVRRFTGPRRAHRLAPFFSVAKADRYG